MQCWPPRRELPIWTRLLDLHITSLFLLECYALGLMPSNWLLVIHNQYEDLSYMNEIENPPPGAATFTLKCLPK